MSMANENEPIYVMDSPLRDDDNNGVGYEGRNGPLKKGPWTIAEDLILAAYVANHGEGNWNAVQRHTELARCGKSCRLRWTNHLRPDLRKGAFTPEEERRVVELHAQMGNKWARMVAELPGRTDNEIKNFWNTRIKRRQRAGLPIYPPDVLPDPLNENQQNDTSNPSSDFMQNNNIDIPPLEFKNLEFNQQHLYPPPPLNMPSSSLMAPNLHSSYPNNAFLSTFHPSKRLKGSNGLFPDILNAALSNFQPSGSQYQTAQPFNMVSSASTYDSQNANISNTAKLEFPSFQCQLEGWSSSSSPMTSLDSINILTQTPETEQNQSCDISPKKNGLLEEVLLESKLFEPKTINNSNSASDMAVDDMLDNTYHDFFGTDWEIDGGFLSMFTGNSLDEHQPIVTAAGGESEAPPPNLFPAQSVNGIGTSSQNISSRPDVLLGSDFFSSMHTTTNDQVMLKDAIETVLADDLSLDFTKAETSLPPGHQQDSCAWNNAMSSSYALVPQFDEM